MLDEETYRKEIVRMWDTLRTDEHAGERSCKGVRCGDCHLYTKNDICKSNINAFGFIKVVEEWSKEHPQKHKVSKMEYDILEYCKCENYTFNVYPYLTYLIKKGHFEGADKDTIIYDYLDNCEVVDK